MRYLFVLFGFSLWLISPISQADVIKNVNMDAKHSCDDASHEGMVRYNPSQGDFEICRNHVTGWEILAPSSGASGNAQEKLYIISRATSVTKPVISADNNYIYASNAPDDGISIYRPELNDNFKWSLTRVFFRGASCNGTAFSPRLIDADLDTFRRNCPTINCDSGAVYYGSTTVYGTDIAYNSYRDHNKSCTTSSGTRFGLQYIFGTTPPSAFNNRFCRDGCLIDYQ